jgi:CRP/FNR family transcriptional regulator, cyclic AMP receptor protein
MTANDMLIAPVTDHGLLKDLDPRYAHKLAGLALEAHFSPEQVIFKEKDTAGFFYLLLSGSVALEIVGPARRIEIETLHGGDGMGWSALLSDEPKHLQARALTDVRALAFEGKGLREAFENDPRFGYALMKRLLAIAVERLDATGSQLINRY